jgi:hypothetical protein
MSTVTPKAPDPRRSPVSVIRRAGPAQFRKVLVCGVGRSGTTALASVLGELGCHLGEHPVQAFLEDSMLRELLLKQDAPALIAELERWAGLHRAVAWKDPKIHTAGGPGLLQLLPHDWLIVAVFRDPVAVAQRRAHTDGVPLLTSAHDVLRFQLKLLAFVDAAPHTAALVSYERFMVDTTAAVEALRSLLEAGPDAADAADVARRARAHQGVYLNSIHSPEHTRSSP